jgi:hypothetical protein
MWSTIGAILRLISIVLSIWMERNKNKRKMKKDAMKEVTDGIKAKDPSRITAGFDRLSRL